MSQNLTLHNIHLPELHLLPKEPCRNATLPPATARAIPPALHKPFSGQEAVSSAKVRI